MVLHHFLLEVESVGDLYEIQQGCRTQDCIGLVVSKRYGDGDGQCRMQVIAADLVLKE